MIKILYWVGLAILVYFALMVGVICLSLLTSLTFMLLGV